MPDRRLIPLAANTPSENHGSVQTAHPENSCQDEKRCQQKCDQAISSILVDQVANDYSDIEFSSFKTSIGLGIRYALNPEQRFNIRADIAWVDGGFGAVINVREAF